MATKDSTLPNLSADDERIATLAEDIGCRMETVGALLLDAAGRDHNEHLARAARHLTEDARKLAGEIEKIQLRRRSELRRGA